MIYEYQFTKPINEDFDKAVDWIIKNHIPFSFGDTPSKSSIMYLDMTEDETIIFKLMFNG